jgi:hypothetical protein
VAVFVPVPRRTLKHGGHDYLARLGVKHILPYSPKLWIFHSNGVFFKFLNAGKKRKLFVGARR